MRCVTVVGTLGYHVGKIDALPKHVASLQAAKEREKRKKKKEKKDWDNNTKAALNPPGWAPRRAKLQPKLLWTPVSNQLWTHNVACMPRDNTEPSSHRNSPI